MELETADDSEFTLKETCILGPIDPKRARFPCCIVWTPLPLLSWFIPFIGHIGICREDGVILDFAGPNFVCVDHFTFGAVVRYIQLNREEVGFFFPLRFSEGHSLRHVIFYSHLVVRMIDNVFCFLAVPIIIFKFISNYNQ